MSEPRKILGIEARVSWANIAEIAAICIAAATFYVQSNETRADVEALKPQVEALRMEQVRGISARDNLERRIENAEETAQRDRDANGAKLTRIEDKIDDLAKEIRRNRD